MPPRRGKRKVKAHVPPRRPPPRLEYRASDDAWYAVRLVVQEGLLRVMYENFLEEYDVWYEPGSAELASPGKVAELRARFRLASPPLEDAQCGDLRPGQILCVFCAISEKEQMYHDAVLDSVKKAAHGVVDGEERCACRFKVKWTEGKRRGCLEEVGIDEVCCVQNAPVQDPVLSEFLDSVTKSFGNGKGDATAAPGGEGGTAPV